MTSITAKVEYVKAQPRSHQHTCHWPDCETLVPPAMWGCNKHWFTLPREMRVKIWQTYRPGQEIAKNPSADYLDAAKVVQRWIRDSQKNRS
jgi:hypothetical protein